MTVHVLHAGDGYTYLTRQVASGDHQRRRGQALSDYYTAAGNPPGRWVGTGREAMGVDGQVSEAQMKALFGEGLHPDADTRIQAAVSRGVDREAAVAAVRLGRRFPSIDQSHEGWRDRLNAAYADFATAHGHRPELGPERDLVRWNVVHQLFLESHQREPRDDAELKAFFTRVAWFALTRGELKALTATCHQGWQCNWPFLVALAGPPSLPTVLSKTKSDAERHFTIGTSQSCNIG